MAKSYDTKEDLQRDVLEHQAKDLRLKASKQLGTGAALLIINLVSDLLRARTDLWKARKASSYGLLGLVSELLGIAGGIKIFESFSTSHKAHDLELQRERMGPAKIVLPPEVTLAEDAPEQNSGYKHKHHPASSPTSLIEQAARQDVLLTRQ
jgi:hypothetical protein